MSKRALLLSLGVLATCLLAGLWWWRSLSEPLPRGEPGPAAEALAARMMKAAHVEAWERLAAVRFRFRNQRNHLWDRRRGLAEVRWGEDRVLLRLADRTGLAFHAGLPLSGLEGRSYVRKAYRAWRNDAYWLNPLARFYDPGAQRERVHLPDQSEALLVRYGEPAPNAGDAYLWLPGDDGLPVEARVWVGTIPVGGSRASWEGWTTLPGGAKVATRHRLAHVSIGIDNIEGAATLQQLVGPDDPFAPLLTQSDR
ncbi:MAG: hypothetical protein OEZ06_15550 [Myxococcales bacterium]|nr:hypothetical protein [Myxococcales bacterium]